MTPTQVDDLAYQLLRCAVRAVMGTAGPVCHAGSAHRRVPARPSLGRRPGHVEMLGRPNNRPALIDDQTRQQQPPARSQNSVSVDHEGLPFVEVKW